MNKEEIEAVGPVPDLPVFEGPVDLPILRSVEEWKEVERKKNAAIRNALRQML